MLLETSFFSLFIDEEKDHKENKLIKKAEEKRWKDKTISTIDLLLFELLRAKTFIGDFGKTFEFENEQEPKMLSH